MKSWTRSELGLVATAAALVFSRVFGISLVLPDFVPYAKTLTGSAVLAGVAFGAYGLTLALMQLPMGLLSDRFGRRRVLIVGTLFFVGGSAWAAVAGSIGTLIAARLVQGLGAISSTAMALVGESIPGERRTVAMAMIGVPAGMGFFLGLMAGPLLSPALGVAGLFWVTAGIGAAALLPMFFLRIPAPIIAPSPGDQASLTAPVLGLAFAGFVLNYSLMTVMYFLGDDGRSDGRLLLPLLVFALVVMGGASRAVDKRGWTWQPITVGALLLAGGAAATVLGGRAWPFWVGGAVFFSAHATLSAVLPSQVSRIAGRSGGRGHGIQNVVAYIGTFTAGPVAGAFTRHALWAMLVLGGVASLSALATVGALRAPRPAGQAS